MKYWITQALYDLVLYQDLDFLNNTYIPLSTVGAPSAVSTFVYSWNAEDWKWSSAGVV